MFFPCRIQASAIPVHAGCDPVVEAFLGWTIKRSETILKFNRHQHGRKETYPFIEETFGHQIKKESEEQTFSPGKSMVTESKEVVNSVVENTKINYAIAGLILISTNAARGTDMMPIAHALLD